MGKVPSICIEDYADFTFDVVSPELPCGVAWLANCFLELNIPVWRPWDLEIDNDWNRLAPFHYQYTDSQEPSKQTLPALQYLREFQFNPDYAPYFRHQWPISCKPKRRLIFFVRDPRDALFSIGVEHYTMRQNLVCPLRILFTLVIFITHLVFVNTCFFSFNCGKII